MCDTESSFLGMVVAILEAASLVCTMRPTNSSPNDSLGTSLEAARLPLCAVRDTHSSFLGMVVAILEATTFDHCSMRDTHSSLNDLIGTFLMAA
jgi:hypothetical protein